MGGPDGGGYDVNDQHIDLYTDTSTPQYGCAATGTYTYDYAFSFCNTYSTHIRYLTPSLLTISFNGVATTCSTWSEWQTTNTSNGVLLAPYGRPTGYHYSVSTGQNPTNIIRYNNPVHGWEFAYV